MRVNCSRKNVPYFVFVSTWYQTFENGLQLYALHVEVITLLQDILHLTGYSFISSTVNVSEAECDCIFPCFVNGSGASLRNELRTVRYGSMTQCVCMPVCVCASMEANTEQKQAAVFYTASQLTTGHSDAVHKFDTAVC